MLSSHGYIAHDIRLYIVLHTVAIDEHNRQCLELNTHTLRLMMNYSSC
jgi:hypothetical protein